MRLPDGTSTEIVRPQNHAVQTSGTVGDLGAIVIPDVFDKYLGDSAEADVVKEAGGKLGNAAATSYVSAIGQKLVAKSKRPAFGYKFDLVSDQRPNAFALPNGSVYVTMGLIRLMRNDAQLANVLGHEATHVTHRHSAKQLQTNVGALGILELASLVIGGAVDKQDSDKMKDFVFGLISNGYSREHESEADEVGQSLAASSGWSPQGMVDVMNILGNLEKEKPKGLEPYFRSHPYAPDRAKLAQKRLGSLPTGEVGADSYRNFLTKTLGLQVEEAEESPVKTGPLFIPDLPPAALQEIDGKSFVPALLLGGGVLALLAALYFRRD